MAILTLHRKLLMKIGIPYWLFFAPCSSESGAQASKARSIYGQPIGIMRGKEANIQIPEGTYNIGVKMVFALWKWRFCIGSETQATLTEGEKTKLLIRKMVEHTL